MIHDCIIIGGGLAGLSAANRLVDLGIRPVVIESGTYPMQKVCGEFFSPECLTYLRAWNIHPPAQITTIKFISGNKTFDMNLPQPAGGISRALCDQLLMQRAQERGATIMPNTKVMNLRKPQHATDPFDLTLSNGITLQAQQLIIATGRYSLFAQQHLHQQEPIKFIGIKTHFENLDLGDRLTMYALDNIYLGHSHVENNHANVSCLARIEDVRTAGGATNYMKQLLATEQAQQLRETLNHGRQLFDWVTCSAPQFGKRKIPHIPRTYIIGDAAGAITPACGDGLAMAITSGHMVGDFVIKNDHEGFKNAWHKRYQPRLRWGNALHEIMLRPILSSLALNVCTLFPSIPQSLFEMTRENSP